MNGNPPRHPATDTCDDSCPTWLHSRATCCHFHDPDPQPPAAPETDVRLTEAEWEALTEASFRGGAKAWRADVERIVAERLRVVEGERDDLADRLSALLCDLTSGLMSKTNYPVSVMVQAVEAEFEKYATDELRDATTRAESAEAAHEALRKDLAALAEGWQTEAKAGRSGNGHPLLVQTYDGHARSLRALLAGDAR